jgi:uncharacterized protein (DUF2062 family)
MKRIEIAAGCMIIGVAVMAISMLGIHQIIGTIGLCIFIGGCILLGTGGK